MEKKNSRRWQLQDLLHAVGEENITQSNYGDSEGDVSLARNEPIDPKLMGTLLNLDIVNKKGLPAHTSFTAKTHIFLAIRKDTRGHTPTLQWTPPIRCGSQMKTTLEDMQLHSDDDRRYVTMTLRAQPLFQGTPAIDNVKVWIEEDAGHRFYFGRCFAFFVDAEGQHYVGLRWYAEAPNTPPGAVLELTCLDLAAEDKSSSYSILPVECIVNGAILLPSMGKMWALQSPREELAYASNKALFTQA
jgi:hypothetical protein